MNSESTFFKNSEIREYSPGVKCIREGSSDTRRVLMKPSTKSLLLSAMWTVSTKQICFCLLTIHLGNLVKTDLYIAQI